MRSANAACAAFAVSHMRPCRTHPRPSRAGSFGEFSKCSKSLKTPLTDGGPAPDSGFISRCPRVRRSKYPRVTAAEIRATRDLHFNVCGEVSSGGMQIRVFVANLLIRAVSRFVSARNGFRAPPFFSKTGTFLETKGISGRESGTAFGARANVQCYRENKYLLTCETYGELFP